MLILALSTNTRGGLLDLLCCLGLLLRRGLCGCGGLLGGAGSLLLLLDGPGGFFSHSLPEIFLLVLLGQDLVEGSANDGSLELVSPPGPSLGGLLFNTLPVLASVQHSPCHLAGVALQKVPFWLRPSKNLKTLPSALTKVLPLEG